MECLREKAEAFQSTMQLSNFSSFSSTMEPRYKELRLQNPHNKVILLRGRSRILK